MRLTVGIIAGVLLLSACEKSGRDSYREEGCENPLVEHKYSANIAGWFSSAQYKSSEDIFLKMSSNTGLTESMKVSGSKDFYYQHPESESCDPVYKYPLQKFEYSSLLYNIVFEISKGYVEQWGPYTGVYRHTSYRGGDPPLSLDSGCLIFKAPVPLIRYDMIQDSIKSMERPYASAPNYVLKFLRYEDCFEFIGSFTVKDQVFDQVYRLKNIPVIASGADLQLSYLWIDKEYGVVQLQQKNGTIWYLEVK